jgi:RNA-directed DNA polymerase
MVLEGDIKGCFDGISHNWLMAHIPMDKSILRKVAEGWICGATRLVSDRC